MTSPVQPSGTKRRTGCTFKADFGWAGKLASTIPLFPGARVSEASGGGDVGCQRRIVTFTAPAPLEEVVDFYRKRVTLAGYSVEQLAEGEAAVLGGTRGEKAFYVAVRPIAGGSAVDLVTN